MTPAAAIKLAENTAAAIDLAENTGFKGSAVTVSDIHELINVAAAFPTERDVHLNVCWALVNIARSGTACAQRVLDSGAVATLLTVMSSWPDDAELMSYASAVLYWIAVQGGPLTKRALVSTSGVVDALRRASAVLLANGWYDNAARVLSALGV